VVIRPEWVVAITENDDGDTSVWTMADRGGETIPFTVSESVTEVLQLVERQIEANAQLLGEIAMESQLMAHQSIEAARARPNDNEARRGA
jgi:hypothetical protein